MTEIKLTIKYDDEKIVDYVLTEELIPTLNISDEDKEMLQNILTSLRKPRTMPWLEKSNHLTFDLSIGGEIHLGKTKITQENPKALCDPTPLLQPYALTAYEIGVKITKEIKHLEYHIHASENYFSIWFVLPHLLNTKTWRHSHVAFIMIMENDGEVIVFHRKPGSEGIINPDINEIKGTLAEKMRKKILESAKYELYLTRLAENKIVQGLNTYIRDAGIPVYGKQRKTLREAVDLLKSHASARPLGPKYWICKRRFRAETISERFERLSVAKRKLDEMDDVEAQDNIKKLKFTAM